ncbi:hypothetical protein TVAG_122420 [Trichomonas vaginalis G3]|uniref:DnaK protein n=1 Tax=Trichomonas vaginalis (strain ATCC PRA-98 / G3) TaxID=412133 RepID=A2DMZ9_TRIV3|nr:ATP binding [Trichomonas vaginalis G3]EAY18176.1 hypothetical protein TVAG_122420 [Trichomonas vaginalis G3]KAI5491472.1 ATP binding [Trichomonas vaginalis G3]|eukprot:XP_001579162.1 hypothetical protein [Trichomonas vaginalis G3]
MNLNFEVIAAHVSDYIKNENFFDTFEIEDIKRIMKYSHLTADQYVTLLKQSHSTISAKKLYLCTRDAKVTIQNLDEVVLILRAVKKYMKFKTFDSIIDVLNQKEKEMSDFTQEIKQLQDKLKEFQNENKKTTTNQTNENYNHSQYILTKIPDPKAPMRVSGFGIDFGVKKSCLAVSINGESYPILINGNERPPSNVGFYDDEPVACADPSCSNHPCLEDIKLIIGKKFSDPDIQKRIPKWDFKLTEDSNGMTVFEVPMNSKNVIITPEEALTMIYKKLLWSASIYRHPNERESLNFVLTVPVTFNLNQINIIKSAAKSAGINVISMIYEPVAVAISCGMHSSSEKKLMILYFDHYSFEVTILEKIRDRDGNDEFKIIANFSDLDLGEDFMIEILMDYFSEVLKRNGYDINCEHEIMKRKNISFLRNRCKRLYKELTCLITDTFYWPYLSTDSRDFRLRRHKFEELLEDHGFYDRIKNTINTCLRNAKYKPEDIDSIICHGSGTRFRYSEECLYEMFNQKDIRITQYPQKAIAKGAAIYARLFS